MDIMLVILKELSDVLQNVDRKLLVDGFHAFLEFFELFLIFPLVWIIESILHSSILMNFKIGSFFLPVSEIVNILM